MMKNAIYYYYQLSTSHVHQDINKRCHFFVGEEEYLLEPVFMPITMLQGIYELSLQLFQRNIYCHQFVLNKDNNLVTYMNQTSYVLLRVYYHDDRLITVDDVIEFSNRTLYLPEIDSLKRDNWYTMWTEKIDYFEYQISQFGKKYPLIRESFSYFVGLAETAISLLNYFSNIPTQALVVARRRIKSTDTLFDLYNPLNFIIDNRIRDASEYFKQKFFENPYVFEDIKYYLETNYLSDYEMILFFARMLFPTYYFDLYEDILLDGKEEKSLLKIIEQIDHYQILLKNIYFYLKEMVSLPEIEWLIK